MWETDRGSARRVTLIPALIMLATTIGALIWQMRAAALVDAAGIQQGAGFWLRDGARLIQVGQSEPDGSLTAVRVFELDPAARLVSATAVARARFEDEHWIVEDIRETRFTDTAIELRVVGQAVWAQLIDPRLANLLARDAQTLSLGELGKYIAYLRHTGSSARDYQLSYWQRLAAPLSALAMLLLSVSLAKTGPLNADTNAHLPNVTGALHMGHVLNNTLQDVLARRARQQGCEVLWLLFRRNMREYSLRARRGVVLCAGGFVMNDAMLERYAPRLLARGTVKTGSPGDTGSGIRMGQGVGAAVILPSTLSTVNATFQGSYDDTYNALLAAFEAGTEPNIVQNFDLAAQTMFDTGKIFEYGSHVFLIYTCTNTCQTV